ncbi:DUF192 domain-containing protein [Vreelandella titanicae]|uniref:DUF192 domain-containing protein n=1 Tax=Vreelandella titanicae TaxID=664683 RepID=UPI001F2E8E22|nr:DUF192 domain-containing protein [Halomonas titanicae]MCE7518336.1 DUF192 domain-containing protein [Halomonas titanicae]
MGYKSGKIYNLNSNEVLFSQSVCPEGFLARLRGLQWRAELNEDQAWWFRSCNSVHTFGMKFSLDVIHLSDNGMIIKIDEHIKKRRISFSSKGSTVVEIKAGLAASKGLKCGIFLGWSNA